MRKPEHIIAIPADPDDLEDGDVTEAALQRALTERAARLAGAGASGTLLDADVLAKFRAPGPGWRARMNDVLRAAQV